MPILVGELLVFVMFTAVPDFALAPPETTGCALHGSVSMVTDLPGAPGPCLLLDNDPATRPESYMTLRDTSYANFHGDFLVDVTFALRSIGMRYSDYNGSPRIVTRPGADEFYKAAFYIQVESFGEKGNLLNCGFYNGLTWDEVRMGDSPGEPGIELSTWYRVILEYCAPCSSLTLWVLRPPEETPFFAQRVWHVARPRPSPSPVHIGYGGPGSRDSWFDGYVGALSLRDSLASLPFDRHILPLEPPPPRPLPLAATAHASDKVELSWPGEWGSAFRVFRRAEGHDWWNIMDQVEDSIWTDSASPHGACYRVEPLNPPDSSYVISSSKCPPRLIPRIELAEICPSSCFLSVEPAGDEHIAAYVSTEETGPWQLIRSTPPTTTLSLAFQEGEAPPRHVAARYKASDGSLGPLSEAVALPPPEETTHCSWAQIPVLVVLFRVAPKDTMPLSEVDRLKRGIELAREFYWRNSFCKLDLDLHYLVVDHPLQPDDYATDGILWPDFVEPLLRREQVDPDEFGIVFAHFPPMEGGGNYGGMTVFGHTGYSLVTYPPRTGVVYPAGDPDINYAITWLFCHELQHGVDLIAYEGSGEPAMWHGDQPLDYAIREGQEFSYQAGIFRSFDGYLGLQQPWGLILESVDRDQDGVPDNDPRVPLDEARFGSSDRLNDTDGDGLADLLELSAGIYASSDPNNPDTDGDGKTDDADAMPLQAVQEHIEERAPAIDGIIDPEWSPLANSLYWSDEKDFEVETFVSWSEEGLCLGLRLPIPTKVVFELDCTHDGWWHGSDNVLLKWIPDTDSLSVKVMDATTETRDFQEKEVGHRIEAWDSSPAYQAAFGRLLEPSAVEYVSTKTPSGGVVLELLIPAEPKIGLAPQAGHTFGLAIHFPEIPATFLERYELGSFTFVEK